MTKEINAEVVSVSPDKIRVAVTDLESFRLADDHLRVGSYLRVSDNNDVALIAVICSFSIEVRENGDKNYVIDANPLGVVSKGEFTRGGDSIAIPPKSVSPAPREDIDAIYHQGLKDNKKFEFSRLARAESIRVPVDGDKFFNKHIGVVGSTGSGKSNTVATILQKAISSKAGEYNGLNNSHIIIFDIHAEYGTAFDAANQLDSESMIIPYWLLNSEELEELFLDAGDNNNYNQSSILRAVITQNKKKHNKDVAKVFYDSPLKFDIDEVLNCLINLKNETENYKAPNRYMIVGEDGCKDDGSTTAEMGVFLDEHERFNKYFEKVHTFRAQKNSNISKGDYADGTLDKFISRFTTKYRQDRLNFIFGSKAKEITFEQTLRQFLGYKEELESNVTIIDLSGVPFEVLSITVSLISRLLFDFGYNYKRQAPLGSDHKIPILLVFEEAHKYVPKSDLARFRASRNSIERIAKEGRKYGVTLLLASQRPSEISETIFSQCSNFVAMRLTNPDDQNYVRKILPDTFGSLTSNLSSLQTGEALLMGDASVLPSLVKIDQTERPPSSKDIPYLDIWAKEWEQFDFTAFSKNWR